MPILPYDTKMPETDIRAVMLFPGSDHFDQTQRRALQARFRQKAVRQFYDAGGTDVPSDLTEFIIRYADEPDQLETCRDQGLLIGEMVSVLFGLYHHAPQLMSWNRAISIVETGLAGQEIAHSKGTLKKAKKKMMPVAHLWGACALRHRRLRAFPDVGYSAAIDHQFFLAEAEQLRWFGMGTAPANEPKRRLFDDAGWHMPVDWNPPDKLPDWPDEAGMLNVPTLSDAALADQRPAGWPKASS